MRVAQGDICACVVCAFVCVCSICIHVAPAQEHICKVKCRLGREKERERETGRERAREGGGGREGDREGEERDTKT